MRRSRRLLTAFTLVVAGCDPSGPASLGQQGIRPWAVEPTATSHPTPAHTPPATVATGPSAMPRVPQESPTPAPLLQPPAASAPPVTVASVPPAPVDPGPSPTPTPSVTPSTPPALRRLGPYDADLTHVGANGEPADWRDVDGPAWLDHTAWPVIGGIWQLPTFSGNHYAFRRYAGDAFGDAGRLPDLYELTVRIRPSGPDGTIAVCPYFLDATRYCLVRLDRGAKTVSLWEMDGATPTGGAQGAYDLSQHHRGWQPLPSPEADGAYTIRTKVNAQWHSLAVWIGSTWIDTPKVDSVTPQPHGIAMRSSGDPQAVVAIRITPFTDPNQAR